MALQRPSSYTVFAIFNFILGGLWAVLSLFGLADSTIEVNNQDRTKEFAEFLVKELPAYNAYRYGSVAAGVIFGVGLIVAGVGLLKPANWGRVMAILCSLAAAAIAVFYAVYSVVFVGPAFKKFFDQYGGKAGPIDLAGLMESTLYVFAGIYGVIALFFLLEALLLSLAGAPKEASDRNGDRGDYDYDDEDRPRRRPERDDRDRDDDYDDRPRRRRED